MSDFDEYVESYQQAIDHGIAFAGVEHAVFLRAKAEVLLDIIASIGPAADMSVLDVGCGIGALDAHIVDRVGDLHGVDISAGAVERAKLDVPAGTFDAYDGNTLPYDAGTFDVAFAVCVFHHVEPEERQHLASEMQRVLRPGGVAVVFEHNPWNPATRLVVRRVPFDEGVQLLSVDETRSLLAGAPLAHIRARFILFLPSAARPVLTAEKALGWLPLGAQYVAFGRRV